MNLPLKLSDARQFDVVGFGTNAVDHLIRVREFPNLYSKAEYESCSIEAGGEVASTMVGLQRLGSKTAYAGRFGDDATGEMGLRSLDIEGVDHSSSEIIAGAETQSAYIIIDSTTGERTILWRRDPKLKYAADDAPVDLAARARILHLTPHDTDAAIAMARVARDAGTIVSLDIDNVFDRVDELLKLVDVCICSEEFPEKLLGTVDAAKGLKVIGDRFGCPVVGMTLGVRGSLFHSADGTVATEAFAVPGACLDTTGAGDAFRTGFLYGLLSRQSLENCCLYANATAALKCRKPGARKGLPTPSEVQTMLKNL